MSAPPLEAGGGFPGFVDLGSPLPPFFFSFFLLSLPPSARARTRRFRFRTASVGKLHPPPAS